MVHEKLFKNKSIQNASLACIFDRIKKNNTFVKFGS